MTEEQEAGLRALVQTLRDSAEATTFAARWGAAERSERRPRGLRVRVTEGPYSELDVRPWSGRSTGVVDVDLREGTPGLDWNQVQARFGPFYELVEPDSRERWFAVHLKGRDGEAAVLLMVRVTGDVVDAITLRRDAAEV